MAKKAPQSPIFKAYSELKEKHPDTLILFRCGDFYEAYNEDAKACAEILGITLTKHSTAMDITDMAGFPYHALDTYLPKLIRAGKRGSAEATDENVTELDVQEETAGQSEVDKIRAEYEAKIAKLEERICELENDLDKTNRELDNNKICAQKIVERIISETVKYFKGDVPTQLNELYSNSLGKLEYIKLKHSCSGRITTSEMSFLIQYAEVGYKQK